MNKWSFAAFAAPLATATMISGVASADTSTPATTTTTAVVHAAPAYASVAVDPASLPTGEVLLVDRTHRPGAIAAGAKIDGVRIKIQPQHGGPNQPNHYLTMTSSAAAKDYDERPMSEQQVCFDVASPQDNSRGAQIRRMRQMQRQTMSKGKPRGPRFLPAGLTGDDDAEIEPETWSNSVQTQNNVSRNFYPGKDYDDRVQLALVESFEMQPTGPTLAMKSFWIDAETGGARLQHQAALPLRDLGILPTGVHLYAGKTATDVLFVGTRTEDTQNLFTEEAEGGVESANCGHMVVPLALKRGLSAETVFVTQTARQPASAIEDAKAKLQKEGMSEDVIEEQLKNMKRFRGGSDSLQRSGHVVMSTQWEADETKPLIAFSSGWDTREKTNE